MPAREQMDSKVSIAEIFAERHPDGKPWLNFQIVGDLALGLLSNLFAGKMRMIYERTIAT